ncbi:meiosis regulator and mRNA stability factor 1-like isoform X3 [Drosophila gunungcola]|uniref:meiosis regulator and mRNA stability factor 1-like isoform X3 n=1 Tax=Drosophila gunungcola TaxID=103775 RepID=UPI0022E6EFE6|nr:meiosis regulator and mRNA stability factor 1-like isoform X3 [Drosophila gunungcola]
MTKGRDSLRRASWPYDRSGRGESAFYEFGHLQSQLYQPQSKALPPAALNTINDTPGTLGASQLHLKKNWIPGYTPPSELLTGKYLVGGQVPTQFTLLPMPGHLNVCQYARANDTTSCYNRNRYMPYNTNRASVAAAISGQSQLRSHPKPKQQPVAALPSQTYQMNVPIYQSKSALTQTMSSAPIADSGPSKGSLSIVSNSRLVADISLTNGNITVAPKAEKYFAGAITKAVATEIVTGDGGPNCEAVAKVMEPSDTVTLQITNLDYSLDESRLHSFLMNQLKPITPVVSLVFEGSSYAKVTVPDLYFAKQVVSNLHRKKIGHKRMLVSYTRDSSLTEVKTLRCQVAGLLKDVPYYALPMYKFRELFQSRFKTSISVLDLYKMQDICTINSDINEDKFISLKPELVNTLESSPLMEGLQHSVPYCSIHLKREQHKGWAEQEIEPLPNVHMTISEIQKLIYPLLRVHPGDIPVATLLHCIKGQLKASIVPNESGVNLEHLVCCVQGIQIQINNFGIKILGWLELSKDIPLQATGSSNANSLNVSDRANCSGGSYFKNSVADPLFQISREVIELVKMSPKSTMKFNRFIPAYHNHFGKQCRVADYGYTKLIELFEALSSVVQIMGDGENRQITLTHRTQIRRFTSDLLRVLRAYGNNSVLLSQLPGIFSQAQNRSFDVTDYGVCDIADILDGLVNSNIVVLSNVQHGKDILISMPKRKQTSSELEKTSVFAGEMVELLKNSLQYSVQFQKFVRSYHYHFAYQCRLSDYGFLKLADLMDAIHGLVEIELTNDEDKKIILSPKVARRVFGEQCEDLIRSVTGNATHCMKLDQVLMLHKKKYGYQIQPQTLGVSDMATAVKLLPYVELKQKDQTIWLICHNNDLEFRLLCYRACKYLVQRDLSASVLSPATNYANLGTQSSLLPRASQKTQFISEFNAKHKIQITEQALLAMRHAIKIYNSAGVQYVRLTGFMRLLIAIVCMLEQRPSMYLCDIKNALDTDFASFFEFGFPNLYSVIAAHEDLFTVNNGPTQERSDVSLNPNCELRQISLINQHLGGLAKMSNIKHIAQGSFRTPIDEHNNLLPTQSPQSSLSMANDYAKTVVNACNFKFNNFQFYDDLFATDNYIIPPLANSFIDSSLLNSFGSALESGSLCKSFCNKENSMNSSSQLLNSSLNSSNELNVSLGAGDLANVTSSTAISSDTLYDHSSFKLCHRRNSCFNKLCKNMPIHLDSDTDETCNLVSVPSIGSIYDPLKNEMPTTKKLPFWNDPIWSARSDQPRHNILNIRLPELKTNNMFPILLSPYTISKNENLKRKLFNFENHVRKIA